jgi:hypothetical protein
MPPAKASHAKSSARVAMTRPDGKDRNDSTVAASDGGRCGGGGLPFGGLPFGGLVPAKSPDDGVAWGGADKDAAGEAEEAGEVAEGEGSASGLGGGCAYSMG